MQRPDVIRLRVRRAPSSLLALLGMESALFSAAQEGP